MSHVQIGIIIAACSSSGSYTPPNNTRVIRSIYLPTLGDKTFKETTPRPAGVDACLYAPPADTYAGLLSVATSRMSTAASSSSPTTRSRTLLFISYRDSRARSSRFSRPLSSYDDPYQAGDEHEHLITSGAGHVALEAQLPPRWYPSRSSYVPVSHV